MSQLNNFDMVIFGATGDLSMRKLLPCLYQAHAAGLLHPNGRILGVSRSQMDTTQFLAKVQTDSKIHIKKNYTDELWTSFVQRIQYLTVDVNTSAHFDELAKIVKARTETDNVVIYLSTAPKFFAPACENLARVGLNADNVRIVLEKPLGTDLASSQAINTDVGTHFKENQIYRIDHYLGKESLQNVLPLRFGNVFFEPVWNKDFIKSVQITVAEQLGVEERGEFYDITGALRDMMQNHIMQMLCFVAMEQPKSLSADDVRDEKLKVVAALKPMTLADVDKNVIRAQYVANGEQNGYLQEHNVPADSRTETYVAIRAEIDTPRWAGVPFYLRTGKRLATRTAEIVLNFKDQANGLFGTNPNRLVISLQPDETVSLKLYVKQVGSGLDVQPTEMVLDMGTVSDERRAEAYELLLREVIDGRLSLFNRRDELEKAWEWVMPILDNWATSPVAPATYAASSWGPKEAQELLARDGNVWLEEQA
ncbi:glucose-6-phosphate dehydrogenase [Kingella kingae]|uniref:Glucose-6-phosphate 1-dehydrogenase n=1 Tax=Kingella kingae TaxID=504 RepID=A0A1W1WWY7_KINKI|nr:glucose-6-phosphate dehydrogenase [Kingella kingae]EIC14372.1 glucose-6-phosphate 1-dehydrogenase [Kingella kingae PYKK081]MBD3613869.1 glucose-6-phosphate dehydrogenase [Kingella kingae]MBD3632120.1 glucose-6-phosphate dehydrogenase [Kingella kingae]MBD3659500.1 glucose-6-phosphate dehydrogenase [Kingella kingae]MDK4555894.1 glucose-6-phosphate dehydrogenase [Kingella kingae]